MVVFTCNHCGESVHKPKVEKHYQFQCRNYKSLTCVDCFKDFRNEEYVVHTKCLTEDERYAAKGTYKNGIVKKGDFKQDNWIEMIKSICNTEKNLKPSIRNLLNTISEYSNVPRKKQKFMNFIKSSSGNRANMKEVEEVWDIIEKYKVNNSKSNNQNNSDTKEIAMVKTNTQESEKASKKRSNTNEDTTEDSPKKKKNKSVEGTNGFSEIKNSSDTVRDQATGRLKDSQESVKFNFKEKIIEILKKKNTMSRKKLQKKILKAYINATGESDCDEKVIKKLNKKIKKIPNVVIEEDTITLQE